AMAWARLHRMPNADKRLVVTYHSEAADRPDVGSDPDTYLDAQASLAALLRRLRDEGYDAGDCHMTAAPELAMRIALDGTNLGAGMWGPTGNRREDLAEAETTQSELHMSQKEGYSLANTESQNQDWYA